MNAIILAAGLGSRLRPITDTTPKSLIYVNGKPLIENQIEYLYQIGITKIQVVVGYLADHFQYLVDKYNVELIYNKYYSTYNNIYTMSLVIDSLSDTYVIDADVFMSRNFLRKDICFSTYFSGPKESINEWMLSFDKNGKITDITYSNGLSYIMSGVSFWGKNDAILLKAKLKEKISANNETWMNLYWDDIVKENIKHLNIKIEKIDETDWYEIDSVSDYNSVLKLYPNK